MPEHKIPPVYNSCSEILILGSFPSVKSREAGFYYAHPQNRFWRVLAAVLDEPDLSGATKGEKINLLLRRRIALWDVLQRCEISGSSDASIRDAVPNDIAGLIAASRVRRVYTCGGVAGNLYKKYVFPLTKLPATLLPSTSAANAACSLEQLIVRWRALLVLPEMDF